MTTKLPAMALLLLSVCSISAPSPVHAASRPILIATPSEGHPGDAVYLSGGGFPANTRLNVSIRCGSGSGIAPYAGPKTDARGQFAGYQVHAVGSHAGSTHCTFSAAAPAGGAAAKSRVFHLYPAGHQLQRCTVSMCLHVQAFLVRLKNGAQGNIAISGWPGARVDLTVARVDRNAKYRHLQLDWRGQAKVRLWVEPGLIRGVMAETFVHARLGGVTGTFAAPFHVMPGGR